MADLRLHAAEREYAALAVDALAERYQAHLETLGIDVRSLEVDHKGTLAVQEPAASSVASDLPRLAVSVAREDAAVDLVRHETIGRGGMGLVWAGTQKALRRRVAVKELIDAERPNAQNYLLREAMITGALEHPNVVPVHLLGRDEAGRPLLVMKRIEGTLWREQLVPLYPDAGPAEPEVIERHLGIFLQVCNAVDFAHSRGVIHRDLKPDNVMVGAFGEVYVLDWGIARTTDASLGVPALPSRVQLVGTPAYMAPEMAAADPERCDKRTDVYLLGAVLHEVITGAFRHAGGGGLLPTLARAYRSDPVAYGPSVPEELAQICNRATASDPARRFPDAAALREAVRAFLRHRASKQLSDKAALRLQGLAELLADDARGGTVDAVEIHTLASEARFGLEQALQEWRDNADARARLQKLIELMIEYELDNGNVRAASGLISELPERRPDLEEKLREAITSAGKRRREIAALERMLADGDLTRFAHQRLRLAILYGVFLTLAIGTLTTLRYLGIHQAGYPDVFAVMATFTLITVLTRRVYREGNLVMLRIIDGIVATVVLVTVSVGLSWLGGVPFTTGLALVMFMAGVGTTMMAVFVERGLGWTAAGFLLTAVLVLAFPAVRGIVMALGCGGSFAIGAWVWRRLDRSGARAPRLVHQSGRTRTMAAAQDRK